MKIQFRILVVVLFLTPLAVFAQKAAPAKKPSSQTMAQKSDNDCFHQWYSLFRERGAAPVTDGTHDVVISLWNSATGASRCYLGKVDVSGGKIKRPILVQKEDGSFEPFSTLGKGLDPSMYKTMSEDQMTSITDGMSVYVQLSEMEGGQIFFYTFINPKPKALKEAPSPAALVKN